MPEELLFVLMVAGFCLAICLGICISRRYSQWAGRAVLIAFVTLSALLSAGGLIVGTGFGYHWSGEDLVRACIWCVLLAVGSIGLARLSRRAFLVLGLAFGLAIVPALIGAYLRWLRGGSIDEHETWFSVSMCLVCLVSGGAIYLAVRGWRLYFRERNETDKGIVWSLVWSSFLSVLFSFLFLPMFIRAGGAVGWPGVVLAVTAAAMSAWAFIRCPRRCRLPKLLTFLLLWPGLWLGLFSIRHSEDLRLGW
jgi:hypothetical protein